MKFTMLTLLHLLLCMSCLLLFCLFWLSQLHLPHLSTCDLTFVGDEFFLHLLYLIVVRLQSADCDLLLMHWAT